jgi:hypothetical protein
MEKDQPARALLHLGSPPHPGRLFPLLKWKLHITLHISTRDSTGRSSRAGPLLPSEGSGNRRCVPECGAAEGVGRQNGGRIHQNHQVPQESRVRAFRHGPKGKPSGRCSGGHAIHGRRGKKKSQRPTSCISLIRTTAAANDDGPATARLLKTEPESMKMALSRTPQPWLCRSRPPTPRGAPHARLAPCPLRRGGELCPSNQGRDGEGPGEGWRCQLPRTGPKPSNGSAADGSDSGGNMEVSGWESARTSPSATSMNSLLGWRLRRKRLCSIA